VKQGRGLARKHQEVLVALLGLVSSLPLFLATVPSLSWLPRWLGAAVALAALLGALAVFWHAGALRARYVVLFAVALAFAAVTGQLLTLC
jgi:hypothetical protein